MPTYCFSCEKCNKSREVSALMSEVSSLSVKCSCGEGMYRDFSAENVNLFGPIKTLGSVADRNTDSFSSDYKEMQKQKNKEERSQSSVLDKYGLKKYEA